MNEALLEVVMEEGRLLGFAEPLDGEIARREKLYAEYKAATGKPSNRSVYEAKNSGIHKPQFYAYLKGMLPLDSLTCVNFERFLREKKKPVPRRPRD